MNVTLDAYAKINLYLDIVCKRENGYHDIRGIMHKISLCDRVSVNIEPCKESLISLTCTQKSIPCDERNIAYKAARMYLSNYTTETYKISIHIEKHIPAAGGLAGGSTDGAAVLKAMHNLLGGVEYDTLVCDSARLGADLPFCMVEGAMITEGIGDVLTPCPSLPPCYILICNTGEAVSTPAAYSKLDDIYDNFKHTSFDLERFSRLRDGLASNDILLAAKGMYNVFEEAVLSECPLASSVKAIMLDSGAVGAMMSGSGSTIFGIYENESDAQKTLDHLTSYGYVVHLCKNS